MKFKIRIANKNISIHSIYSSVYYSCKEYIVDDNEKTDIFVYVTEDMIEKELIRFLKYDNYVNDTYVPSKSYLEIILIHKIIAEAILDYNTFLMHGAVIAVDGFSYMFMGTSGTGKTTHVLKWIENVEGSFIVNGDKPFIILKDEGAYACGTPWNGKENYGSNAIVSLRSIILMERSDYNHIEPVSFNSILPTLIEQTFFPDNPTGIRKTLKFLAALKDHVTFYRFYFNNFDDDAFLVPYNVLTNQ